ncbi:unnamed protein product, partial [Rotaria sp. Silwood1]
GIRKTDNELEDIIEKGIQGANTFSIMIDTEEIRQQAIFIEERHRDIQKLENSIRELHAMFADLALLVSTQGEMIDNIQQSVAKAAAYVKPAVINIEDARKKKDSIRKKKIIICIIVIVIIVILILIFVAYHTTQKFISGR